MRVDGILARCLLEPRKRPPSCSNTPAISFTSPSHLTTTMELTAAKVPFIYVPLRNHFEQNFHVRARLDRYRAGRYMDYEDVVPDNLGSVMAQVIGTEIGYLDVEADGAAKAAAMISELL